MTTNFFSIHSPLILMAAFWLWGWFYFIVLAVAAVPLFIYMRFFISKIKNKNAHIEGILVEKEELLKYAVINEQKAKEEAVMTNRSKNELLSKISHQVRTPMNAMLGMTSLLNETNLNIEQREYMSALLKSGEDLLSMINDILMKDVLQYSKLESAKALESKYFNLRETIEEVLDVFASKASQRNIDLLYKIDDHVPVQIVGDTLRLRQILMNFIENAFRFTDEGEVFIGVQVAEHSVGGLSLEFEIRDSGRGMNYERLKQISVDLVEEEADSEQPKRHIGLALNICNKLVRLMGGFIEVESEENAGTTFRFTICTGKDSSVTYSQKQIEIKKAKGREVLIIDDNATSLQLLKEQMNKWDMAVHTAQNGEEAIAIVSKVPGLHAVLTDFNMPGMNGVSVATEIKKINPSLPIVLMQKNGEEIIGESRHLFQSFINKPLRQQNLANLLNSLFDNNHDKSNESILSSGFAEKFPLKILVAEDDAMNQQMIKMVMKKLGYECMIVKNGKEVLEEVSHFNYDFILMDILMPEMDGLEATKMIRLCLEAQPVIVAMTANTLQGDREDCIGAGMNDYLSKPLNLSALVSILEKWSVHSREKYKLEMRA